MTFCSTGRDLYYFIHGYSAAGINIARPVTRYRHNLGSECYAEKLEVGFGFPQAEFILAVPPV